MVAAVAFALLLRQAGGAQVESSARKEEGEGEDNVELTGIPGAGTVAPSASSLDQAPKEAQGVVAPAVAVVGGSGTGMGSQVDWGGADSPWSAAAQNRATGWQNGVFHTSGATILSGSNIFTMPAGSGGMGGMQGQGVGSGMGMEAGGMGGMQVHGIGSGIGMNVQQRPAQHMFQGTENMGMGIGIMNSQQIPARLELQGSQNMIQGSGQAGIFRATNALPATMQNGEHRYVCPQEQVEIWRLLRVAREHITLGQELGRGAFAVTHEGRYRGSPVAIKRLFSVSFGG